jgi:Tol biopolymer transport system component
MPDIVNPYIPGQPVDGDQMFFGRRDMLASLREHLVRGRRVFIVSGARRMGKSSFLRQVSYHLPEEFIPVHVELLDEDAQRFDWLLWRLANAIGQQVEHQLGVAALKPQWSSFDSQAEYFLEQFWPRIRATLGDRHLLLLLDDVDYLAEQGMDLLEQLVAVLADWRDRDEGVSVVLSLSSAMHEVLVRQFPRLFGGATSFSLGPLASEEATRLITWPVDGLLTYDFGVARRLIEITSGHPYYLQLLCFEIFNRCAASGWANQHDLELVVEDLIGREIADFRSIWDESSPQEQAALAALVSLRGARGVATVQEVRTILTKAGARVERDQVAATLESLAARGILERLGALSYRFRVALIRDWLQERIDLQEVVRDTRWSTSGRARSAGERRVPKLRPRRERRRARVGPRQEAAGSEDGEEPVASVSDRRWLWIVAAIGLGLVVVYGIGLVLLRPPAPDASPTATPSPSPTMGLATATLTPRATASAQPAVLVSPTSTPPPSPTTTPSPTPPVIVARAVPSIVYQSRAGGEENWSIYVMNSDGSSRTRLTDGLADAFSPVWSPGGADIAYVSDRDGSLDIWVMASDGSRSTNLTDNEAQDRSPAWSSDGRWIAFASVRDALYWEVYVMASDGSDARRLTWWEDASDWSPSWSPDGTRLAFASKRDGNWEIYVMDRDGGNLVRLTDHPADDTNPAWSPDGGRIAFESTRAGYTDLYVMSVTGGEAMNLTDLTWATDLGPTWSPDGGRIAFYSDRDGEWDIYVMASDGSDVVKLTGDDSSDQEPAWRP